MTERLIFTAPTNNVINLHLISIALLFVTIFAGQYAIVQHQIKAIDNQIAALEVMQVCSYAR